MEPIVSAIITTSNHARFIGQALNSVSDQGGGVEIIVADDCSSDGTPDLVLDWSEEKKIPVLVLKANQTTGNPAGGINIAVENARGKYVSVMSGNNFLLGDKFDALAKKLDSLGDKYAVAYGSAVVVDDDNELVHDDYAELKKSPPPPPDGWYFPSLVASHFWIPPVAALVRRSAMTEPWDAGTPLIDWDFWLRLSTNYYFACVPKRVAGFRATRPLPPEDIAIGRFVSLIKVAQTADPTCFRMVREKCRNYVNEIREARHPAAPMAEMRYHATYAEPCP